MGSTIEVVKQRKWEPKIKSEMLKAPVATVDIEFGDDDVSLMDVKQRAAFDAAFKTELKNFDREFDKLSLQKTKEFQDAISWTEEQIKKKPQSEQKGVVETANKMLDQGCKTFADQARAIFDKFYEIALEKSYKAMKLRVNKARAKAIVKIVIIVALTITAAGLAIAASVATGGAAAPLVIGALLVGAKAGYSVYKTVTSEWANAGKTMKLIAADLKALSSASKDLYKVQELNKIDPSVFDKLKKAKALVEGHVVALEKHAGQLEKYVVTTERDLKDAQDKLLKMMDEINKSGDRATKAKIEAKANALMREMKESLFALDSMKTMQDEVVKVRAEWNSVNKINAGNLGKAAQGLMEAAPHLQQVATLSKEVMSGFDKLAKALK